MKVTEKKFLNVHQTFGPMTVAAAKESNSVVGVAKAADKLLVSRVKMAFVASKMTSISNVNSKSSSTLSNCADPIQVTT